MPKVVTIRRTFNRDQLLNFRVSLDGRKQPFSEINTSNFLMRQLLMAGIPVIGLIGLIAVEWGQLTVTHEDGLDGDEWTYSWTGEQVPLEWRQQAANAPYRNLLTTALVNRIAEADEL